MDIPDLFIIGYGKFFYLLENYIYIILGLDFDEIGRQMPDVYSLVK